MNILARIRSYDDLAAALKTQRCRSGISQTMLEQALGWNYEYLWKLESQRRYPAGRLKDWLAGLDLELLLVRRGEYTSAHKSLPAEPSAYAAIRKKVASKGGRAASWRIAKPRKRENARNAARARWDKERQRKGRGKP
jgi:hypothetical protein